MVWGQARVRLSFVLLSSKLAAKASANADSCGRIGMRRTQLGSRSPLRWGCHPKPRKTVFDPAKVTSFRLRELVGFDSVQR